MNIEMTSKAAANLISAAQEAAMLLERLGESPGLVRRVRDGCFALNVQIHESTHVLQMVAGGCRLHLLEPDGTIGECVQGWDDADRAGWTIPEVTT